MSGFSQGMSPTNRSSSSSRTTINDRKPLPITPNHHQEGQRRNESTDSVKENFGDSIAKPTAGQPEEYLRNTFFGGRGGYVARKNNGNNQNFRKKLPFANGTQELQNITQTDTDVKKNTFSSHDNSRQGYSQRPTGQQHRNDTSRPRTQDVNSNQPRQAYPQKLKNNQPRREKQNSSTDNALTTKVSNQPLPMESKKDTTQTKSGFSIHSPVFYPSSMVQDNTNLTYQATQYNPQNVSPYSYPIMQQGGCYYYYPPNFYFDPNSQFTTAPQLVLPKTESEIEIPNNTKSKRKGRKEFFDDSSSDEDDETESISSNATIQLNFDEDDYIVGFASFNGSLYFCWQKASKESESQSKIREILNQSSKYTSTSDETLFSTCIKNKSIYAALKKFVKKLIKQNQPYNPYLINSHSSILMKLFLLSSNTWLEFAANLPAISNKFAKLKAREVKLLLSEYSTEWYYFEDLGLS